MTHHEDLESAITARDRARSRVRVATITVGAAGLATAGLIAYSLPAPASQRAPASSPGTNPPGAGTPTTSFPAGDGDSGERSGGDSGERSGGDSGAQAPAPAPGPGGSSPASHTTSGGS